ncbi:porin [Halobacteriovorax sp. RT-2-4]|uniref:porin n=1 Tax=unclassified Halobacteriovorax TaxID=2639665 RepID=UPI00399B6D19
MTGIIAMAVLSSAAFANTIVPETSRDGKTKNSSVIATTGEMRTFVAGEYNSKTTEADTAGAQEVDTTNMNVYGAWSNKMISVEADINMGEDADTDNDSYGVQAAYRINKQFAVGLGYTMMSQDTASDDEQTKLEIAGSYNMNDLVIGASFAINSEEDNAGTDGSFNTLTVGVGSNANNMSWEAGLTYTMEEDDAANGMDVGSKFELFAGMTKVVNNIELDGDLSYTTGDASATAGGDYTNLVLNFDAEFLVGKMFYITPGLNYSSEDVAGTETNQLDLSADFGYRANKIDATFGIDYAVMAESNNVDFDSMAWKVNVAYNF